MLDFVVLPLLRLIITFDLDPNAGEDEKLMGEETSRFLVDTVFSWLYHIFWLWPIYGLGFIINSIWYQGIVDATYDLVHDKNIGRVAKMDFVVEKFYYAFLTVGFYIQMYLVTFIPIVGDFIGFVHFCWLYSLYSFDYKWEKQGRKLTERLQYLERRWPYFLGFGFPLAALSAYFPWIVHQGLIALTAPVFIMLAIMAEPVKIGDGPNAQPQENLVLRLPIYWFPRKYVRGDPMRLHLLAD